MTARVAISHTWDGDLRLTLISPQGTAVTLADRRGGSGDDFIDTVFDDSAAIPIASGAAPFSGSFRPESPLAALAGQDAAGTWQLNVADLSTR